MPSQTGSEEEFYNILPDKNKCSHPKRIVKIPPLRVDEYPDLAVDRLLPSNPKRQENMVEVETHLVTPNWSSFTEEDDIDNVKKEQFMGSLSGCFKRISNAFNSRPVLFLNVVFLTLSFAFFFTSILSIKPVIEEKDYLATAFNQSKRLHTMCIFSFESLSGQLNSTRAMLNATLKEKAYLQEISDLKTKEWERQQKTVAEHKSKITELTKESEGQQKTVAEHKSKITELTKESESQQKTVAEHKSKITELTKESESQQKTVAEHKSKITELTKESENQQKTMAEIETQKSELTKELENQQKTIAQLKSEISELKENHAKEAKSSEQESSNVLENLGAAKVDVQNAGTWDFITRLFSGSSAVRPSYLLTTLALCLPALLQFLHHINK